MEDALAKVQRTVLYCFFFYSFYRAVEFKSRAFFISWFPAWTGWKSQEQEEKQKADEGENETSFSGKKGGPQRGIETLCLSISSTIER